MPLARSGVPGTRPEAGQGATRPSSSPGLVRQPHPMPGLDREGSSLPWMATLRQHLIRLTAEPVRHCGDPAVGVLALPRCEAPWCCCVAIRRSRRRWRFRQRQRGTREPGRPPGACGVQRGLHCQHVQRGRLAEPTLVRGVRQPKRRGDVVSVGRDEHHTSSEQNDAPVRAHRLAQRRRRALPLLDEFDGTPATRPPGVC